MLDGVAAVATARFHFILALRKANSVGYSVLFGASVGAELISNCRLDASTDSPSPRIAKVV